MILFDSIILMLPSQWSKDQHLGKVTNPIQEQFSARTLKEGSSSYRLVLQFTQCSMLSEIHLNP